MRFFNFFLNHMVQKYQNEIAPIFYYGKSPKANEKDLKIPYLQPPDWGQPYWMTRYVWHKVRVRFKTIGIEWWTKRCCKGSLWRTIFKFFGSWSKNLLRALEGRGPRIQNRKRMSGLGPSKAHHKTHMNSGPAQAQPHQTRWQRPHLDQSPHLQVHLLPIQ